MITQNSAQIYLADKRKQRQTSGYHCWSTLGFDNYQDEANKAFGSLFLFNYQILAPDQNTTVVTQADCIYYILPLYGGVQLEKESENNKLILSQKIEQLVCKQETPFQISNPFSENVSYVIIGFISKTNNLKRQLISFDFQEKNKLTTIFENEIANIFVGNFDGRKEAVYHLKSKQNGIFAYIIQGAFEFENRLLETGDALSIKNIDSVEWEALSQNAMLLLIEIPFT